MVSLWPRRLRDKIWPEPLPPIDAFDGQTVLITGATGGLGMAAAINFATVGANVIMTSRSLSKGKYAKDEVERRAGIVGQGRVHLMELDMSQYSSCVSFVSQLKQSEIGQKGLDVAVLNAGLVNVDFVESPEGWEQLVQVHTLSTTLLGLLLLDWMKQKSKSETKPPHLIFVTSRKHILPDITSWVDWSAHEGVLHHLSKEQNWNSGEVDPNYSETKLMLMYTVEQICKRAMGPNGGAEVIVNTVCPGLVNTDLGRSVLKMSWFMRLFVLFYFNALGKSPEHGSRSYLIAAQTTAHEHGKFIQSFYTQDEYHSVAIANITSDTAIKVKGLVWDEIIAELRAKVPAVRELDRMT